MFSVYTLAWLFSLGFLILVIEYVRRGKLLEQYSLLWVLFASGMLILSLNIRLVDILGKMLQIYYAPSVLFLLGFLFIIVYSFHLTVILSKQSEKLLRLTQEMSLLRHRLEEHEKQKK
ncbi:MAG: DUF2304 domain-containing protein [Bacillota bacterium]